MSFLHNATICTISSWMATSVNHPNNILLQEVNITENQGKDLRKNPVLL